jgi:hypothetical protein
LTSFIFDLPLTPIVLEGVATEKLQVAARLDDALRGRLETIHAERGTNTTDVIVRLIKAFCDYVDENDGVRWPVKLIYDEGAAGQVERMVAEPPKNPYRTGPRKPKGGAA